MSASAPLGADADLVAGVLAGDREAFAGVYEKYADRLHDFAFSMLRSREEAADCVADSFVVMAEKLGQLRDPSALRPWLYSVVRNECHRTLRGRARLAHDDEWLEAMPDQGSGPEQQIEQASVEEELRELVWSAIEGLNDRDRSLLDLHLRQGLDGAELAAAMDVTPSNSYVMLSRARAQVERSLGALLIARRGSDDCEELAVVLEGWDGRFSPLIRKRVARHIDGCDVCASRRRLLASPLALLAGVPAFAAPAALRDRVLDDDRLVAYYVDSPGAGTPAVAGVADSGRRRGAIVVGLLLLLLLGMGGAVILWPEPTDELTAVDARPTPTSSATSEAPAASASSPTSQATLAARPSAEPSSTATSDTTIAAPAQLALSTRSLSLGTRTSSGSVRLTNTGGTPLTYRATAGARWLGASPRQGSLAPGASTTLRITAERSGLGEGTHRGQVAVAWGGGTEAITVSLTVARPPVVGTITASGTDCSVPVSASVTDGGGIASVRVSWSGAVTGQTTAARSGGRWRATIPVTVGGTVKVTFTATDSTGLRASRSRTFTFNPCPG